MIYGPRDLPDLRRQLYTHRAMPNAVADAWARGEGSLGGLTEEVVGVTGNVMRTAPLHYIEGRFGELVTAAAPSLPLSSLAEHDLPTPTGFMYFANGHPSWIAMWSLTDNEDHSARNTGVVIWWLRPRRAAESIHQLPPHIPSKITVVGFEAMITGGLWDGAAPGSAYWLLRHLLTTWHLQRQRLTTCRITRPPRATLRRLARSGDDSDPVVRIISLRVPHAESETSPDREFRHQWIVRGHWRQQWYSSIQDHRPVWIAPHLKGPDGAPLLGGEKVYAWRR